LALKNQMALAPLQRQEMQQRVQLGQGQLQEQQQQIKDAQTLRTISPQFVKKDDSGKPIGYDYDGFFNAAQNAGVSPTTLVPMQKNIAEAVSSKLKATKEQRDNEEAVNNQAFNHLEGLRGVADPNQRQQMWNSALQWAQQNAPSSAKTLPQQAPDDNGLGIIEAQLGMHAQQLSDSKELADQGQKKAQTASEMANAARVQYEMAQRQANGGMTPAEAQTGRYQQQEVGIRKQQLGIEGARLAFEKAKQGTQDSQAIEAQAQSIASGDVKKLPQTRNNAFNNAVMARAYEINPKLSDSLYTMTQDLRSTKPTSMGANVGRLGTAILHADRALDNSKSLGFSEGLLTGIGTAGTSAYKQDAEFLTGEVGQFVTGGKLTVDEGKKISSDLMSSRQSVRDSALHEVINLSKGKLQSQMGQFKNATQTEFPIDRVFSDPDIKASLQKHGVIGGAASGVSVTAPNGKTYSFKDQASADAFKQKAGIQ